MLAEDRMLYYPASGRLHEYDRLISLGCNCQPAFQIRRRCPENKTFFFDWLVTPLKGLMDTLETDFRHVFREDNLACDESGRFVEDRRNGLQFYHLFSRDDEGKVQPSTIRLEYARHRAKIDFLIDRWHSTLRNSRVLLIRVAENGVREDVCGLQRLLHQKYPTIVFDLLLINAFNHAVPENGSRLVPLSINVRDDASWDLAFS